MRLSPCRCSPNQDDRPGTQIVVLYDQLLAVAPSPVVALNRAIAVGEVVGPAPALTPLDGLDLQGYQPFHAARADLLRRAGRTATRGSSTNVPP